MAVMKVPWGVCYYTVYAIERVDDGCRSWKLADIKTKRHLAQFRRDELADKNPSAKFRVRCTWVPA